MAPDIGGRTRDRISEATGFDASPRNPTSALTSGGAPVDAGAPVEAGAPGNSKDGGAFMNAVTPAPGFLKRTMQRFNPFAKGGE